MPWNLNKILQLELLFDFHVNYPGPEQNRSYEQLFCKQNCFPVINYRDVHRRFTVTEEAAWSVKVIWYEWIDDCYSFLEGHRSVNVDCVEWFPIPLVSSEYMSIYINTGFILFCSQSIV